MNNNDHKTTRHPKSDALFAKRAIHTSLVLLGGVLLTIDLFRFWGYLWHSQVWLWAILGAPLFALTPIAMLGLFSMSSQNLDMDYPDRKRFFWTTGFLFLMAAIPYTCIVLFASTTGSLPFGRDVRWVWSLCLVWAVFFTTLDLGARTSKNPRTIADAVLARIRELTLLALAVATLAACGGLYIRYLNASDTSLGQLLTLQRGLQHTQVFLKDRLSVNPIIGLSIATASLALGWFAAPSRLLSAASTWVNWTQKWTDLARYTVILSMSFSLSIGPPTNVPLVAVQALIGERERQYNDLRGKIKAALILQVKNELLERLTASAPQSFILLIQRENALESRVNALWEVNNRDKELFGEKFEGIHLPRQPSEDLVRALQEGSHKQVDSPDNRGLRMGQNLITKARLKTAIDVAASTADDLRAANPPSLLAGLSDNWKDTLLSVGFDQLSKHSFLNSLTDRYPMLELALGPLTDTLTEALSKRIDDETDRLAAYGLVHRDALKIASVKGVADGIATISMPPLRAGVTTDGVALANRSLAEGELEVTRQSQLLSQAAEVEKQKTLENTWVEIGKLYDDFERLRARFGDSDLTYPRPEGPYNSAAASQAAYLSVRLAGLKISQDQLYRLQEELRDDIARILVARGQAAREVVPRERVSFYDQMLRKMEIEIPSGFKGERSGPEDRPEK